jgi:hypothetical protein
MPMRWKRGQDFAAPMEQKIERRETRKNLLKEEERPLVVKKKTRWTDEVTKG